MMHVPRASVLLSVAVLVLAGLWATLISAPHVSGRASTLDRLESALLDVRHQLLGPVAPAPEVAIVVIDDLTLAQHQGSALSNRGLLTETLTAIFAANPKVVGLDVILADPGDAQTDAELAKALALGPTVIAAGGVFSGMDDRSPLASPTAVLRPQNLYSAASDVGLVNLSTDATGTPRYASTIFTTERGVEPAFALMMASRYLDADPVFSELQLDLGSVSVALDEGFAMPLRLVGPAQTIPTYSASEVLSGTRSAELGGKAVLVGITAAGFGDRFPTPFDVDVPGVEIMAGAVSQLLGGPGLRRDPDIRWFDAGLSVGLAVAAAALVLIFPLSTGVPLALGVLTLWAGAVLVAFASGVWLAVAVPLVSAAVSMLVGGATRYLIEKGRARRGAAALLALKQFQSPVLAEMIAKDPDFLSEPTPRRLSVFFIDLSAFTLLSEKLGPARTQDLLKQFHQITAEAVEAEGGVVLNYMGDGALAVFGMLEERAGTADQALRASFALISALDALGGDEFNVGCRIGLHFGEVVLSRLGGDRHQQVSVAGDSVNLASRLLDIAKENRAAIAATDVFLDMARQPLPRMADAVKTVPVRGRADGATVHFWTV